jgi:RNA polymerase sigma-70 factor (ECF subfamily)
VIPKCDFDEFYRDAYARLVGQVFVLTGDLGAAQDAVQEAFVRAWSRWDRVSGYDAPWSSPGFPDWDGVAVRIMPRS